MPRKLRAAGPNIGVTDGEPNLAGGAAWRDRGLLPGGKEGARGVWHSLAATSALHSGPCGSNPEVSGRAQPPHSAGMQGCSAHLVHFGYHLPPAPHLEAQKVVELLGVPQALHELHAGGSGRSDPWAHLVDTSARPLPALEEGLGCGGAVMRSGGAEAAPTRRRLAHFPTNYNGPPVLAPLPVGARGGLTGVDWLGPLAPVRRWPIGGGMSLAWGPHPRG